MRACQDPFGRTVAHEPKALKHDDNVWIMCALVGGGGAGAPLVGLSSRPCRKGAHKGCNLPFCSRMGGAHSSATGLAGRSLTVKLVLTGEPTPVSFITAFASSERRTRRRRGWRAAR